MYLFFLASIFSHFVLRDCQVTKNVKHKKIFFSYLFNFSPFVAENFKFLIVHYNLLTQTSVISPLKDFSKYKLKSFSDKFLLNRYINLETADSVVISFPLITPISFNKILVS